VIVTPFTHERIHKTVWDVHTNGNVFPGLSMWDVHKNGNVFLGFTVWDVHTYGNDFLGFTVWDVHSRENDLIGLPCGMYIPTETIGFRCLARSHMAPASVPGGPIPNNFWVVMGRIPYLPHSLGSDSKCRRGKGLKTVCIALMRTSAWTFGL